MRILVSKVTANKTYTAVGFIFINVESLLKKAIPPKINNSKKVIILGFDNSLLRIYLIRINREVITISAAVALFKS